MSSTFYKDKEVVMRESFVEAGGGARLWCVDQGAGVPLVLCHGGPGLWDSLGSVAGMVDDLARVIRWDQRGCGRSAGEGPHTVAAYVEDLDTLRRHFGFDAWVVGGHSWGASLALSYALAHPDRTRGVVYLSGTGLGSGWRAVAKAEQARRLTTAERAELTDLEARPRTRVEESRCRRLSWITDLADRSHADELMTEMDLPYQINFRANAEIGVEVKRWHEADQVRRCRHLETPALIVHGAQDPRPPWAVASLADAVANSEVHVLDGVGHLPWLEAPNQVSALLREFIGRV